MGGEDLTNGWGVFSLDPFLLLVVSHLAWGFVYLVSLS